MSMRSDMNYRSRAKGIRFNGGKSRCGGIVPIINALLPAGGVFHAPFCGSCKIEQYVRARRRYLSDLCPDIICLLKAVQAGWDPPTTVTEKEYTYWKSQRGKQTDDPTRAFVLYGCSFGARYGEGYARSKNGAVNFAATARLALLRQKPFLKGADIYTADYRDADAPEAGVVYCDPIYEGTKPCGSVRQKFDSATFWKWAVKKARNGVVLVSEYTCPVKHAVVVWEKSVSAGIRFGTGGDGGAKGSGKRKQEKLFLLNPEVRTKIGMGIL
jgi:DNA adenine methylase